MRNVASQTIFCSLPPGWLCVFCIYRNGVISQITFKQKLMKTAKMSLLLRSLVIPKILQPLSSQVLVAHKFSTQQPADIEPAPEDFAISTQAFFSEKAHITTEVPEHLQQYLGNEFEVPEKPIISVKDYKDEDRFYSPPREVWIENMDTIKERKVGLATFHPLVYGHQPRIDVIHENVVWQRKYRWVVSITE